MEQWLKDKISKATKKAMQRPEVKAKTGFTKGNKNPNLSKFRKQAYVDGRLKKLYGKDNPSWKGGRIKQRGYIMVLNKEHSQADKDGYVAEHRLIMEKSIGRLIKKDEDVHHINRIKDDNRLENLELMTHGEHTTLHSIGRKHSKESIKRMSETHKEYYKTHTVWNKK